MQGSEPLWIDENLALTLHDRLLVVHGGTAGVRDIGLLRSVLSRPRQHFTYGERGGVVELAAIYTAGIVENHPFVDGNKRTGFVVGILFLELNGLHFEASEAEAAQAVIGLAASQIDAAGYAAFVRANAKP